MCCNTKVMPSTCNTLSQQNKTKAYTIKKNVAKNSFQLFFTIKLRNEQEGGYSFRNQVTRLAFEIVFTLSF